MRQTFKTEGSTCVLRADLHCCTAKTNTTVERNNLPIKDKVFKNRTKKSFSSGLVSRVFLVSATCSVLILSVVAIV